MLLSCSFLFLFPVSVSVSGDQINSNQLKSTQINFVLGLRLELFALTLPSDPSAISGSVLPYSLLYDHDESVVAKKKAVGGI